MAKATFGGPTPGFLLTLALFGASCGDPALDPQEPDPGTGTGGDPAAGTGGTGGSPDGAPGTPTPQPNPSPELPAHESAEIEPWYGSEQTFGNGESGTPQRWVNLLGRVLEPYSSSTSYRVNGGPVMPFPVGPSTTRLLATGDFNFEIERDALAVWPQTNTVEIFVENGSGETLYRQVKINVRPEVTPPPQQSVDWAAFEDIRDIHQTASVVDGLWHLTEDGIRTSEFGYDRLIAIGSQRWSGNYEVLASFTLHHWRNWGGVGLAVGWQGHDGDQDPREEWPLEALGWVRNAVPQSELQLMTYQRGVLERRDFDLSTNVRYNLRLRAQRGSGGPVASLNIWPASQQEPNTWLLTANPPQHDGSVLLVAHHADMTWHTVQVSPLE